jgi:hypothetical protein
MVGTITPLVRGRHPVKWLGAVGAYTAGSLFTSAALGALLGMLSAATIGARAPVWTFVTVAAVLGALEIFAGGSGRGFPHRQTKKDWRVRFGITRASLLWGADLGLGVTTRVTFRSYWLLVAAALLLADPVAAALLLGTYGFGRALHVATAPLLLDHRPGREPLLILHRSEPILHQLHGVGLMLVALLLASSGLG